MNYPSDIIKIITEMLFIETPKDKMFHADLVIVFGSDFIKGTIDKIEELNNQGVIDCNSKIILSGATGSLDAGKESEAKRLFAEALSRGLSEKMFVVEDKATNSFENLLFSKKLIEDMGGFEIYEHILFISKAFLSRRAQMGAAQLGYPMHKIEYCGLVDKEGRNIAKDSWWERDESRLRVMAEVERIGKYAGKGDLSLFTGGYEL